MGIPRVTFIVLASLLVLSGFGAANAHDTVDEGPAKAMRVAVEGGNVAFNMPAHFTPLTGDEIAVKFPRPNPPEVAFGNARRTVTIAVGLSPAAMTMEQLPLARDAMEEMMPKLMPGLEWISREIVTINGRAWIHLAMVTPAGDTKIRNEMLVTSVGGRALLVNLNATVAEYEHYNDTLVDVRNSLSVTENLGPSENPARGDRAAH